MDPADGESKSTGEIPKLYFVCYLTVLPKINIKTGGVGTVKRDILWTTYRISSADVPSVDSCNSVTGTETKNRILFSGAEKRTDLVVYSEHTLDPRMVQMTHVSEDQEDDV